MTLAGWIARTNSSPSVQAHHTNWWCSHCLPFPLRSLSLVPCTPTARLSTQNSRMCGTNHSETILWVCLGVFVCMCMCPRFLPFHSPRYFCTSGSGCLLEKIDWQGQPPSKRDRREQRAVSGNSDSDSKVSAHANRRGRGGSSVRGAKREAHKVTDG